MTFTCINLTKNVNAENFSQPGYKGFELISVSLSRAADSTGRPVRSTGSHENRSTGVQADRSIGVHTTGQPVVLHCSITDRPVDTGFDPVWPEITVLTPVFGENPN
ncbi:hypothetical protein L484_026106 [Morus notabilis]|uniref:Uncharacterized protein n=1 Tax=Morus notabilis TaxID=981085 RepID=W9RIL4_9ROSA|nr:hypothetical protein L484_026106 [Morus notabilis]